jgi:hypothetical protein
MIRPIALGFRVLLWFGWLLTASLGTAAMLGANGLSDVPKGKVWVSPEQKLRIKFLGNSTKGYAVSFEVREAGDWLPMAAFPEGQVWAIHNVWNGRVAKWYSDGGTFRVSEIRVPEGGR